MSETPRKPYKGLVPFSEEDWPFFFGREREREIITNNLLASRLTLLYGPSGVGKSSVLRAGVTHHLRELAQKNNREIGAPEFAVVMFGSWQDDPLTKLSERIDRAVTEAVGREFEPLTPSNSLSATIKSWSDRLDGDLLIVLDQFEDYFIYHGEEKGPGTFGVEFPCAVVNPNLNVRFLISIREDALPKLDRFKLLIPNLFSNYIRINHFDPEAAREAITKPIDKYNELYGEDGQQFSVEPRLVDAVLEQPEIENNEQDSAFERSKKVPVAEASIEAPYLQLVMDRIWDEEIKVHSPTLRLVTLRNLGGARKIAREHVNRMMKELSWKERAMSANAFRFLIGGKGDRPSFAASELADRTELNEHRLYLLLEKLTGERYRILHSSDSSTLNSKMPAASTSITTRYEISHDMLGKPIEDWRRRYANKAKLIRRVSMFAIAMAVILVVAGYYIETKRQSREKRLLQVQEKLQARVSANVSSQILAQLYQKILGSDDPKETRENVQATLDALNEALNSYRQDNNGTGEGITLNNIAGIYRFLGEANRNAGRHLQAEDYYDQARMKYQQALSLLKDSLGQRDPEVAHSLNDLAYIAVLEGKYADAEPLFERARTILEEALGPDDRYLADGLRNLAECYYREGKYDDAEPLYKETLKIRKAKLTPDDPELAQAYYDLAWLYYGQGKYAQGELLFNEGLALEIQSNRTDPSVPARKLNRLANILYRQHKYAQAEQPFKQALGMWNTASGSQSLGKTISLNGLAAVYSKQGKGSEARQYSKQAQTVDQEAIEQNSYIFAAYDLYRLAFLYEDLGKPEAESVFKQVIRIWENSLGREHPDTAAGLSSLAFFYYRHGRRDDAESLFNEARSVQEALPYSPNLAQTLYGLAQVYADRGKYAEAEPLYKQALAIQEKAIPLHPDFADTLNAYADLLDKTDRKAAADETRNRAEQIRQSKQRESR
jgi:tetratricopeptide (TPR) repeat protein